MERIIIENPSKILAIKEPLQKLAKVKITNRGKEFYFEGEAEDEFIAEKIFNALEMGFPFEIAAKIKKEDFLFEIIDIKEHTRRKDFKVIRGRIIGRKGKTLKVLTELSECFFEIKLNSIGIIGSAENIKNARESVIAIIRGSKQSNVYHMLEKAKIKPVEDFGIKESFEKKLKNKHIEEE